MKRVAFVAGVLALGLAGMTPARADFGVAKFADGSCRAWAMHDAKPWGGKGGTGVAVGGTGVAVGGTGVAVG